MPDDLTEEQRDLCRQLCEKIWSARSCDCFRLGRRMCLSIEKMMSVGLWRLDLAVRIDRGLRQGAENRCARSVVYDNKGNIVSW